MTYLRQRHFPQAVQWSSNIASVSRAGGEYAPSGQSTSFALRRRLNPPTPRSQHFFALSSSDCICAHAPQTRMSGRNSVFCFSIPRSHRPRGEMVRAESSLNNQMLCAVPGLVQHGGA